MKTLIFHAPPEANGLYSDILKKAMEKEPQTMEEQNEVLDALKRLVNEPETSVPFEKKMIYLQMFITEIMSHSYGLFPKQDSQNA
ncbi:hypothetical protein [Flavisolibacter ginsenosidimutans]|uniref:Uncharacterized protein n=1 Tax=Flavisolibacter ginsenosidimutans TaxID=661481 RepID=A0A5B8ULF4_9BACT|nr:hypothetical protein [Flavisolibacter ginsenosidimutans]QEC56880.1 hypothetical protein FSB75_13570 [Flavisolibacter ginsenosidimutans]